MLVRLADLRSVVADAVAGSHGKVGEGCEDGDHGGDHMVEALGL